MAKSRVKRILYPDQLDALSRMHDGCVLMGRTGSGKSVTALGYWYTAHADQELVIVTTPKKRDDLEWGVDLARFGAYDERTTVVSWNHIGRVTSKEGCFFIFDEQKLRGGGKWVEAFYRIASKNDWILLSATPGDVWMNYVPLFIANGYYKNRTDFYDKHVIWDRYAKYPKVKKYINEGRLRKIQKQICVPMKDKRKTVRHVIDHVVSYDKALYDDLTKRRWDPYEKAPQRDAGALCRVQRRVVNENHSRVEKVRQIGSESLRMMVFYNFDYELEMLREMCASMGRPYAEYNGHKHDPVPSGKTWAYLVHYSSAEAWNCTATDTVVFFSLNYSWSISEQAFGRIDRLNTRYRDLYCHRIYTRSTIDRAILEALEKKGTFNEQAYYNSNRRPRV